MAAKIEIVVQPMLVPNGSINGEKHYRDYGWQWVWLYDMAYTPPRIIKAGVTPSGRLAIDRNLTYQPGEDGSKGYQELLPMVRDMDFRRDEEPFGMIPV